MPNLLVYPGSVLVLDPKGENASLTAVRRGNGLDQDVYVIDPFVVADVQDDMRAGFNPFDMLDPESPTFIDDCDSIADALIVAQPNAVNDHWNGSTRLILRGFVAWVAAASDIDARDVIEVKRLLHLPYKSTEEEEDKAEPEETLNRLLIIMSNLTNIARGVPAEAANTLLSMGERERGSVLSTIRQNLAFLSSPPMAQALTSTMRSPDLRRWKFDGSSIYLCLPASRLHRHFRFFRLIINLLLSAVEYDHRAPEIPALMLLDEMHVLGHMAMLEIAA